MTKQLATKCFGLLLPLLIVSSSACSLPTTPNINATVAAGIASTQLAQATSTPNINATVAAAIASTQLAQATSTPNINATVAAAIAGTQLAQATITPNIKATVVAGIASTQLAQARSTEAVAYPTPAALAYSTPIPYSGTGPFTIPNQDSVLLRLHPASTIETISFVESLTLHVKITDPVVQKASALDFMFWNPVSGGWGMNGGKNKLAWGEADIAIKYPDGYVSRQGEIMISIYNRGPEAATIDSFSVTLVALGVTGQEMTYNPKP